MNYCTGWNKKSFEPQNDGWKFISGRGCVRGAVCSREINDGRTRNSTRSPTDGKCQRSQSTDLFDMGSTFFPFGLFLDLFASSLFFFFSISPGPSTSLPLYASLKHEQTPTNIYTTVFFNLKNSFICTRHIITFNHHKATKGLPI